MLGVVIPTTTLLYGALNTLLFAALSANVSRSRTSTNTWVGDPVSPELHRAVRAHGNFAESVGIATVLLLAIELGGASSMVTHIFGGTYFVLRLFHAVGTLTKNALAAVGALGTVGLLAAQAVYALILR